MSEHHLPSELERWPSDPHALLNVPRNVDRAALRSAYVRLIRVFKPDHFPEQFRRIREAYEAIGNWLQWVEYNRQASQTSEPAAEETVGSTPQPASRGQQPPSGDDDENSAVYINPDPISRTFTPGPDPQIEIEKLWQQAIDGQAQAVHRKFAEMELHDRGNQELCLRLYWLLKLYPDADLARRPSDWLLQGLERMPRRGPLLELYQRELFTDPAEALNPRCESLLHVAKNSSIVAALAAARWQAAHDLNRFDVILLDFALLRPSVARALPEVWAQLLITALWHLTWADDSESIQQVERMIAEFESLPEVDKLEWAQLRLDLLRPLIQEFDRMRRRSDGVPAEMIELIPESWTRSDPEIETKLLRIVSSVAADPPTMLANFDWLAERFPIVTGYLAELLNRFRRERRQWKPDLEKLAPRFRQCLDLRLGQTYKGLRQPILQFCLREQIAPDQLMWLPPESTYYPLAEGRILADVVRFDAALCASYRTYEALWSDAPISNE